MRGINKLYNSELVLNNAKQGYKGRNKDLISKRNKALVNRYYLYSTKTKVRYDYIIERLEEEFYLSKSMVVKILSANIELLKEMKKSKPTLLNLKAVYPHFNWDLKWFIQKSN